MRIGYRVGILGAGLGSRLANAEGAKPLAKIGKRSLIDLLLERFRRSGAPEILCALRDEQLSPEMRAGLPAFPGLSYLFVNTESSLHTLVELIRKAGPGKGAMLFSMADTVMLPGEFERFLEFCAVLGEKSNAVLLTSFVDDEKPLWAEVDGNGNVTGFGGESGRLVTSGMYFLQPAAMELAVAEAEKGTQKMRNFLSKLAAQGFPIKSFVVSKTIDVDHPSDLEKAAQFLREGQGTDQGTLP
ncbi:MAG TPA: NTP transferase domain-containing protein [Bdellovibrionota bacterium]|jgi:NDP-sugar pyrophosphorylase family protein